ncbi:hypothetical protein AMTRI_Chr02g262390 [Amborella trichopoda]
MNWLLGRQVNWPQKTFSEIGITEKHIDFIWGLNFIIEYTIKKNIVQPKPYLIKNLGPFPLIFCQVIKVCDFTDQDQDCSLTHLPKGKQTLIPVIKLHYLNPNFLLGRQSHTSYLPV